ncbi:HesB/IscA family protein [Pararhodospirillum oryzae]|uniref:Core domain-containing protein n=1 Tax=Pararhodospirillum oryzae TaxID=478448 RepID=A0A512H4N4_9PROT|nr:iron-sulfur cluster assembly accessory protein [Pararhodospirillum oryzae]GEO80424.1 hypothetical protein ROR02_05550 [Pararhodospirillum oryzae]
MSLPPLLTLTPAAVERITTLMSQAETPVVGVRVGITRKGCSGLSYKVDFAEDGPRALEETVTQDGVTVFVEAGAVMFLIGATMDFKADTLSSSFVFHNPNETARCGCGESFTVNAA